MESISMSLFYYTDLSFTLCNEAYLFSDHIIIIAQQNACKPWGKPISQKKSSYWAIVYSRCLVFTSTSSLDQAAVEGSIHRLLVPDLWEYLIFKRSTMKCGTPSRYPDVYKCTSCFEPPKIPEHERTLSSIRILQSEIMKLNSHLIGVKSWFSKTVSGARS